MDLKNVFLNGTLYEEAYMKPPPGTTLPAQKVCLLPHALYGDNPQAIYDLQCYLGKHFEKKDLGTLNYFLGLEILSSSNDYYLSQAKYASDLLSRSSITDSITSSTPLDPNVRLTPFDGVLLDDSTLYRKLVDSLIYLTVTRLNITYVVHIVMVYNSLYSPLWFSLDSSMLIGATLSISNLSPPLTNQQVSSPKLFILLVSTQLLHKLKVVSTLTP
ncbi:putative mitochondrial protein [Cucumis melo var. makuwa]|uniref:Putative mitochondrial protein n=1 Tax=Cucumis melo var. makuwa TaxID=1194695 RepID=A0A5D3BX42_CUCMM|nr:putative mitochondrial protein [Cucumis melo var. makuwa]